jgi:hypothetical protein
VHATDQRGPDVGFVEIAQWRDAIIVACMHTLQPRGHFRNKTAFDVITCDV